MNHDVSQYCNVSRIKPNNYGSTTAFCVHGHDRHVTLKSERVACSNIRLKLNFRYLLVKQTQNGDRIFINVYDAGKRRLR